MKFYRGIALTVAGSDSGGGAGIQAALKTFAALKVFGTTAVTAITAQNSLGVQGIHNVPPEILEAQIESVLSDISVDAVKTGMLSQKASIKCLCDALRRYGIEKVVVDPVMVAQSGDELIGPEAVYSIQNELLPLASLVTPNIPEAEKLSGFNITDVKTMEIAARKIYDLGPGAVLVKGGHMEGETVVDILYSGQEIRKFISPRINTSNTHGTGCTLSSAIAAELSAGCELKEAVSRAREYLMLALENSFKPGRGYGPLGHAVKVGWVD